MLKQFLSRFGAIIGNLNDKYSNHDGRFEATKRWKIIDKISSFLYALPDR